MTCAVVCGFFIVFSFRSDEMYDVYNLSHLVPAAYMHTNRATDLTYFKARSSITALLIVSALAASLIGIESRYHKRDVSPPAACEDIEEQIADIGIKPKKLMSEVETKAFFAEIKGMMSWDGCEAGS